MGIVFSVTSTVVDSQSSLMFSFKMFFVRMRVTALSLNTLHDRILDVWTNIWKIEDPLAYCQS
jgi:hypothetical protein